MSTSFQAFGHDKRNQAAHAPLLKPKSPDKHNFHNDWQRTVGNQALQTAYLASLVHPFNAACTPGLLPKLESDQSHNAYEQEADRVSHAVMHMPEQKHTANNTSCQTQSCNRSSSATAPTNRSLPASAKAFFEPRFAAHFDDVHIHNDASAHHAASMLGARAFTIGNHVSFARGAYAPDTQPGRALLAHELTHVVQSRNEHANPVTTPVSINTRMSPNTIARQKITVDDALRERVKYCVKPFYYDKNGNWDWIDKFKPDCSDMSIPADRERAWKCLNSFYWSKDGAKWDWPFEKEPKCDDLVLPAPIAQIRGETPAETKTRQTQEATAQKEAQRIAKEDEHNTNRIHEIKKATSSDVDALAEVFVDSKIKDDGTLLGRFNVIFRATEHWLIPGLQTGIDFGFSGFKKEFHDPWPSSANQVGHFLTAVRLALDTSVTSDPIMLTILGAWFDSDVALRLIIGHEKKPDPGPFNMSAGFSEQYDATTEDDIKNFKNGDLDKIQVGTGKGNSMADLVLSHKGWLLGRMVAEGKMTSKQDVKQWLLKVLKK